MDYILIYDKVKYIDITLLENFPIIGSILYGLLVLAIFQKEKEPLMRVIVGGLYIVICL